MKKWTIGIILLVIAGSIVWIAWPRKEHVPVATKEVAEQKSMQKITVTSSAFAHNGNIPAKYTCDADDVSPPLEISGVPARTKTLALIMHDPDAPRIGGWTHWVKYNIPVSSPEVVSFKEGEEPEGTSGKGTGGKSTYQGPCPPSETHRYFFSVYALDTALSLKAGAKKPELESAMQGHIIGEGELIGLYFRKKI